MKNLEKSKIEIPLSAKDSELNGWEYTIPEGYEAEIKDGKVIVKKVESEYEKIRESLIDYFRWNAKQLINEFSNKEVVAWLEKQGEQKPNIIIPKFRVGDKIRRKSPRQYDKDMQVSRIESNYYLCNHIGKFSSEPIPFSEESNYELVEQKNDKVEPKFKHGDRVRNKKSGLEQTLGSCIDDVYEGAFPFRIKDQDEWELVHEFVNKFGRIPNDEDELNVLVQYVLKRQKPVEWNEEDDIMVHDIDYALRCQITYPISKLQSMSIWINNLKDRVQPHREWSEEDEKNYKSLENLLNEASCYSCTDGSEKLLNWLKSLRPQKVLWKLSEKEKSDLSFAVAGLDCYYRLRKNEGRDIPKELEDAIGTIHKIQDIYSYWKPTEEQMRTLEYYMHTLSSNKHKEVLFGLMEQLKALYL